MNWEQIPEELRRYPQWVNWRLELRGKKLTKVPYNARTGKRAKANDASTWGTFEDVREGLRIFAENDGLGFIFSESDSLVGIDLDNCIDADGRLAAWAREYVE